MPNIDLRFIVLLVGLMGLLMSVIIFFLRRSLPPSIEGLREWAAAPAIILVSMVLLAMRGAIPDFLSILCGNLLLLVGCLLFHVGTQRFFGVATEKRLRTWLMVLILSVPAIAWCSLIEPDYAVRLRLMAALMFSIFVSLALMVHRQGGRTFAGRFTAVVLFVQSTVILLRFIATFVWPSGTGLFEPFVYQTLYIASFTFTMLLLTVGTVLLATERMRTEFDEILTEGRRTEAALSESDAFLRVIIDSMPDQVAVIDRDGVIAQVNESWRRFSLENSSVPGNPTPHTSVGTNYIDVCRASTGSHAEGGDAAHEGIQAVLEGRLPAFSLDYPCHSPEQQRWFSMRVSRLGSNRGGAVIAHTNITDLMLANDALRQSEDLLKSMTAAVPGVVYQFSRMPDGEWKFVYLSKGIENLYEVSAEAGYRDHNVLTDCILAEDRLSHLESVERSATYLSFWEHEHRIRTPKGNLKWVRGEATPEQQMDGSVLWSGILTDITERKQAENDLRESEERYRLLVGTASEGILVAQGAGLKFVNPMVMEITGYTEEELTSRPFLEFIHQDDRELMKANYLKRLNGEPVPQRYPIRILTKEAGEKWVELSGARIEWHGQPATLNFVTDITEHRQAEQASKDSYERLVTVLNSLDAIVYVSDIETYEVMFVNQFVQGIFGDIVGQPCWKSIQSGQSGPCSFCTNNKLLDAAGNPTGIYHWEFQNTVNGHWYDIRDRAIEWPNGRIVRLEIATDITERKQSHDKIARLMREQQIILDTAPVGISKIIDRKQVWVNRKAEAMFQYSRQEMVGETTRMLYPTQQAYDQLGQEAYPVLSSGDEFVTVQNLIRRDGKPIWVKYEGKAVDPTDMSKGTIWILDDITERKQAEEELLRSNSELEQFSYAISHDMRQPLRMISSYMQLLEKDLADHLDAEKRQHFDFAIDGAKRMDTMMLGLLEYSRVGRKGEPPTWIESRSLLDDALLFLQPAIAEAQAVVRIKGDWPRVHVSPDEILRLIQNLIVNAIKFRKAGCTPEVTVTSETTGDEWRMCVADNGIGILPSQLGRLFQVFQRLQSRADYEGTGIGLALCRKIAEHHGGKIWAESAGEGQGSTFRVELPRAGSASLERQQH